MFYLSNVISYLDWMTQRPKDNITRLKTSLSLQLLCFSPQITKPPYQSLCSTTPSTSHPYCSAHHHLYVMWGQLTCLFWVSSEPDGWVNSILDPICRGQVGLTLILIGSMHLYSHWISYIYLLTRLIYQNIYDRTATNTYFW